MLYTLLAFCFVAHLNDTPTPGFFQEPGAVFSGLPHCVSETAPFMLDIQVYLNVLEFIHSAAGGEGLEVLFRIPGRDC